MKSDAPAELWVSPGVEEAEGLWIEDMPDDPEAVRYVRADLYEALIVAVGVAWRSAAASVAAAVGDIH